FSYTRILNPYTNGDLEYKNYRDVENFKRYKVNPTYGEVPLELRFRIKDAVKIGVGVKVGVMLATKTKYVGPDDEEGTLTNDSGSTVHEKLCYINNVERMAYSATLRVGWRWVSAFAAYQINPVFSVGHEAPTFHPLSVGLTFAPF
ncbi:MAG: outer membrane beta-barrel protein, partial [Bacteroidales bacterium]|nr:outer membrane beta-barrel protein [Bacteroidales bacterium]